MPGSLWSDEQEKPLQHLRVIDLTVMLPGPFLTRILAQHGADVVKVECLPDGDPMRKVQGTSLFELLNQGKRSVAINLKSEEGVSLVKQLAGEADVFIENFREGVMDRYGLGYAEISEVNPDLIYMSVRGMSGKYADRAGHDFNFIAASGVGEWFLESGIPNYSTGFGDIVGGALVPALKLMSHLANPARQGMHLLCSMDESFRSLYLPRAYDVLKAEKLPEAEQEKYGLHHQVDGSLPHSRYYKCRDQSWIALNAIQLKHWEMFCEVVDRPEWKTRGSDPTLAVELENLFVDAPSTYWEALATKRDVCLYRVVPWKEHIGFSQARPQLSADPFTWGGFGPNPSLAPAPKLGAESFAVIHSLGISNKEISEKIDQGVLFQAPPETT